MRLITLWLDNNYQIKSKRTTVTLSRTFRKLNTKVRPSIQNFTLTRVHNFPETGRRDHRICCATWPRHSERQQGIAISSPPGRASSCRPLTIPKCTRLLFANSGVRKSHHQKKNGSSKTRSIISNSLLICVPLKNRTVGWGAGISGSNQT